MHSSLSNRKIFMINDHKGLVLYCTHSYSTSRKYDKHGNVTVWEMYKIKDGSYYYY